MRATDNRRHVGEFLKETKTHLSVHDCKTSTRRIHCYIQNPFKYVLKTEEEL